MRTATSTPGAVGRAAISARVFARAAVLSAGWMASSRSMQTRSAPEAAAFANISGFRPGMKMKLRLLPPFAAIASPPAPPP